jgi:hypothetical protein
MVEGKPVASSCPLTGSSSEPHRKSSITSSYADTALSQDSSDGVDSLVNQITGEEQDTWCGDDLAMQPLLPKGDVDMPIRRMCTESPLTVNPKEEPARGGPKRSGHERGNDHLEGKKQSSDVKSRGSQVEIFDNGSQGEETGSVTACYTTSQGARAEKEYRS